MKIITVDAGACTACRKCELVCSLEKVGEFKPTKARIHVVNFDEPSCIPMTCFQCEQMYCAQVCHKGAIVREEATWIVRVIEEKCTGCKLCVLACPFGNMTFSPEKGVVEKCDLCDGEPKCVAVCETRALEFKEVDSARDGTLSARLKAIQQGSPLDIAKLLVSVDERKARNYRLKRTRKAGG